MNPEWLLLTAVINTMQLNSSAEGAIVAFILLSATAIPECCFVPMAIGLREPMAQCNFVRTLPILLNCEPGFWRLNMCVTRIISGTSVRWKGQKVSHTSRLSVHGSCRIYTWLAFSFKCRCCYRNILNVCPLTRLYLSWAV